MNKHGKEFLDHFETKGVFHLKKISENFRWKFLIGKSAFHLDTDPIRSQAQDVLPVNWKHNKQKLIRRE